MIKGGAETQKWVHFYSYFYIEGKSRKTLLHLVFVIVKEVYLFPVDISNDNY